MPVLWLLQVVAAPSGSAEPLLDARWHATGCPSVPIDEVTVCAERRDRYRLPLPGERDTAAAPDGHVIGEASSPIGTLTSPARCGLFAGERHCAKAEAKRYGYGGGRDPITVLTRLGAKLVDPDADGSEAAPVPSR